MDVKDEEGMEETNRDGDDNDVCENGSLKCTLSKRHSTVPSLSYLSIVREDDEDEE